MVGVGFLDDLAVAVEGDGLEVGGGEDVAPEGGGEGEGGVGGYV